MVDAKHVAIVAGVIGAGAVGIIVLYQLMKGGQLVMPSFQPPAYQAQAQTTQQACAAKGWVWEAGQCKQYPSSGDNSGEGKDDKVPDQDPNDVPKYECCTGGGTVSNPKYCPGGTANPNCPQQEVKCPDYYTLPAYGSGVPDYHPGVGAPAGQACPVRDAGFGSQWDGGKIYGGSIGTLPGSTMGPVTVALQRSPTIGHDLITLDPGACSKSTWDKSTSGDLPKVRIYGPICLRVEGERRKVTGVNHDSCGSYGVFQTNYHCLKPGESMEFRPQKAGGGYLYRKKIYRVSPSQCQCPSIEASEV